MQWQIQFEKINQVLEIKIDNIRNAMFSTTSVQKVILLDVMNKLVRRQSLFTCTIHRKYLFTQSSSSAVREPQRRWL